MQPVGHDSSDTDLDDFDVDFDDFVILKGVTSNLEATLAGGVVFFAAEGGDFRLVGGVVFLAAEGGDFRLVTLVGAG